MAKVEVQIRHCFCCGLHIGSFFVAIYSLLVFLLLGTLALWGLSDLTQNGDKIYDDCEKEALGVIRTDNRKLQFHEGHTTVIVEDSSSYHCSFGLYTEELKFAQDSRFFALWFDIGLYALLVLASVILLVGLCVYNHFFLVPWILLMAVEVVRGVISTVLIFVYSHGNLARIATGIFFLGVQCFHISILLVIIAKAQKIYNRKHGIPTEPYDHRVVYPSTTLPSNYAYSPQVPRSARDPYPYSDYSPSQKNAPYYDQTYGTHRY
ncbi:unnamed protein product [Bursaphelenchus xylophilus]|uniref:(pine wood nematode) hypothetical protein n=1 Tax=Bursaphelenchus xylophilus TaxID=6326 RepID=A0A7I8WKV1_BURXY|nr:unnamed protein product [Bursaphelenchus xylophilus]CAG9106191.1 unnamed protein product [Bursaphelenchus xylophilus]